MRKTITLKYRQTPPDPLELMGVKQQIIPKIEDNSVGALDWYSQNARYVPDDDRIISWNICSNRVINLTIVFAGSRSMPVWI